MPTKSRPSERIVEWETGHQILLKVIKNPEEVGRTQNQSNNQSTTIQQQHPPPPPCPENFGISYES